MSVVPFRVAPIHSGRRRAVPAFSPLMQAMADRKTRYVLDGQVQVDDAYLGGERTGGAQMHGVRGRSRVEKERHRDSSSGGVGLRGAVWG